MAKAYSRCTICGQPIFMPIPIFETICASCRKLRDAQLDAARATASAARAQVEALRNAPHYEIPDTDDDDDPEPIATPALHWAGNQSTTEALDDDGIPLDMTEQERLFRDVRDWLDNYAAFSGHDMITSECAAVLSRKPKGKGRYFEWEYDPVTGRAPVVVVVRKLAGREFQRQWHKDHPPAPQAEPSPALKISVEERLPSDDFGSPDTEFLFQWSAPFFVKALVIIAIAILAFVGILSLIKMLAR
jgi:hypothetical protein